MNAYGNGNTLPGPSAPDIRAMLNASFAEEQESTSAMLARAMIYAQDADRKLEEAKVVRSEAGKYRAEMQRTTVAQREELCRQMHEEADQDQSAAQDLRDEVESMWGSSPRRN